MCVCVCVCVCAASTRTISRLATLAACQAPCVRTPTGVASSPALPNVSDSLHSFAPYCVAVFCFLLFFTSCSKLTQIRPALSAAVLSYWRGCVGRLIVGCATKQVDWLVCAYEGTASSFSPPLASVVCDLARFRHGRFACRWLWLTSNSSVSMLIGCNLGWRRLHTRRWKSAALLPATSKISLMCKRNVLFEMVELLWTSGLPTKQNIAF